MTNQANWPINSTVRVVRPLWRTFPEEKTATSGHKLAGKAGIRNGCVRQPSGNSATMSSKKVAALLADRRVAANDNNPEINSSDVAVADRRHWLGQMEKGIGYTDFEPHPYRSPQRQAKSIFAKVKWPPLPTANDELLVLSWNIEDPMRRRRWLAEERTEAFTQKAKPIRHGLAVLRAIGDDKAPKELRAAAADFMPPYRDRKSAAEGFPVDREFKEGRIAGHLWTTAGDVRDCYETANAPEVSAMSVGEPGNAVGLMRRVHAVQACQTLRYRTMHLWRPLIYAVVFAKTMAEIGREYGGNKEDSAKLGRQKVIDALLLAREVFWDLRTFEREDAAAAASDEPLPRREAYALGRKAWGLPKRINRAANQNMRAIKSVA